MAGLELLRADDSVLLLIDLQNRLTAAMPAAGRESALDGARLLARAAALLALPTLVTRQYPDGLGDIDAELKASLPTHAVTLDKNCFDASADAAVGEAVRMTGRRQVVIAGIESHVCVLQTAAGLAAAGRAAFVVEDASCARDPAHAANARNRLLAAGITVTNRESVIFEWLRGADHPQFKALSALLR